MPDAGPVIRPLTASADAPAVTCLFTAAADYVALESGLAPSAALTDEFFTDAPPGGDPATSLKLGLVLPDGCLAVLADVAFGYPEATDAFIGLMLAATRWRGRGLGRRMLDHIITTSRARGATRLLLAVLEANPRGRAFWQRHGFREVLRTPPTVIGLKTHVRIRMARAL
ncbi:MAG: GNAT family N-acetyltransferase [Pseudorhodobacter sp.]|nr:GNAT family N-acetyltransferase [Pseudorhodobacter sp.]